MWTPPRATGGGVASRTSRTRTQPDGRTCCRGDGTAGPHERPAVAEGLRTLSARDRARETGPVRGAPTSVAGQVAGCVSA